MEVRFIFRSALCLSLLSCFFHSCKIDSYNPEGRTRYALIDYSESTARRTFAGEPLAALAVSLDVDSYLSMTEAERGDKAVLDSLFPEGILRIDEHTVKISGVATVYTGGNGLNVPGTVWKVTYRQPEIVSFDYYSDISSYNDWYHSYDDVVEMTLKCSSDNSWEAVSRKCGGVVTEFGDGQILLTYGGWDGQAEIFNVRSSGILDEGDGLSAAYSTTEDGLEYKYYVAETVKIQNRQAYYDRLILPSAGGFAVEFRKDGEKVDYCNVRYAESGVFYDVSID